MLIKIDLNSEIPIYLQIVSQIKEGIAKGYIEPEQKLPSVRNLAKELGINMHTVSKAYRELKEQNIVNINKRSGAIVKKDINKREGENVLKIENGLREIIKNSILLGIDEKSFIELAKKIFDTYKGRANE